MTGDPVGEYLAALRAELRTSPGRVDEIVAEAEDHLRESAAAREAGGVSAMAAQRAAVAAFGPVKRVTRAHRPLPSDYAAAVAARVWPLFGALLLLTALFGVIMVWLQLAGDGLLMVLLNTAHGPVASVEVRPDPLELTASIGGCALAGLFVLGAFAVVWRRSLTAVVPLPRGLFPLAAAIALFVFAIYDMTDPLGVVPPGALPVMGMYQLVSGLPDAAAVLGCCCVLQGLVSLARGETWAGPRAYRAGSAPAGPRRSQLAAVSALAAQGGLRAGQLLGSYLLLSALAGGIMVSLFVWPVWPVPAHGWFLAIPAAGGVAGALLFAGFLRARRRRQRSGIAPVRAPGWLSALATVAGLAVLAVAEYLFFRYVTPHLPTYGPTGQGVFWLVIGSQFAASLMGAGWAVQALASLVRWASGARPGSPVAAR
jgi:hypothetical protein